MPRRTMVRQPLLDLLNEAEARAETAEASLASLRTEYDEATQELATELADERTQHQKTMASRDRYREALEAIKGYVPDDRFRPSDSYAALKDIARAALSGSPQSE